MAHCINRNLEAVPLQWGALDIPELLIRWGTVFAAVALFFCAVLQCLVRLQGLCAIARFVVYLHGFFAIVRFFGTNAPFW